MSLLKWALIMLVVSIVAALFGFTGLSAASADVARILFYIFVVIFLVLLIAGLMGARAVRGPKRHEPRVGQRKTRLRNIRGRVDPYCIRLRGNAPRYFRGSSGISPRLASFGTQTPLPSEIAFMQSWWRRK
jgi:uncharacterized membrane protein YtjA (UPF0391 family)